MQTQYPELIHLDEDDLILLQRLNQHDEKIRFITLMNLADEEREDLLPWLHHALIHDNAVFIRLEAAKRLEGWEDQDTLRALVQALHDQDASVIAAATQSLSEVKEQASSTILTAYLKSDVIAVKIAILRALKPLRDLSAYHLIEQHTYHEDALVRREAVSALSWLQQEQAIPRLSHIAKTDDDLETRRIATGGLAYCKHDNVNVNHALTAGLEATDWQLRVESANSIGKLKLSLLEDQLIHLLYDPYWQVRVAVVRSLGRLKSEKSIDGLAYNFNSEISNLRKEVALALGEIGSISAIPILEVHKEDLDPDVRKSIKISLNQILGT